MGKDGYQSIMDRKSVRKFLDKEVPEDILIKILDAAKYAPSAWNSQPWRFIVIKDRDHLKKLAELIPYGKFMDKVPMAIAIVANPEESNLWCIDGTCATENLMIAASYFDLGTCWVADADQPEIKKILKIPLSWKVITVTPLGYPETAPKEKLRKDLKELIYNEYFGVKLLK
ncbi:MAG: nitroreductase family protein [Thermoplasmata archaeon]